MGKFTSKYSPCHFDVFNLRMPLITNNDRTASMAGAGKFSVGCEMVWTQSYCLEVFWFGEVIFLGLAR